MYIRQKNIHHDVKNTSWDSWPWWHRKVCRDVKKFVVTSKTHHVVKEYIMMSKTISWCKKFVLTSIICHDIKKFIMTSKSLSWFVMTSKSLSWSQNVHHDVKKFIMMSKVCHDVKNTSWLSNKFVKNMSWRHKDFHDVKSQNKLMKTKRSTWRQKYIMIPKKIVILNIKTRHDVKNTSWRQKDLHDVKIKSWWQHVRHEAKKLSWRQKVCHDCKNTSKHHDFKNTSWV